MKTKALLAGVASLLSVVGFAACASKSGTGDAKQLTVWSLDNDADRVLATQAIADKFSAATGIKVKIVGIDEDQFAQLITSDAAAGKLPDVVGALPLAAVQYMASNKLVNTTANQQVINDLGPSTFQSSALSLTKYQNAQGAVPSDAWVQLLIYRKDLFAKAGLPAPDTFANIQHAAQVLNSPKMAGITMATVPNDAFTEQTFEYFALANNCQMIDGGKVSLNSPACVDTFKTYADLIQHDSTRGNQDVDTTRATYFAGGAAMTVWSSFILDEMAGLRNDALPTCAQCKSDPAYLAKNSGIVTAIQGPDGTKPQQFGEIASWTITDSANAASAQKFVEYMLDQGYSSWLGVAPEGKFPVRQGTKSNPSKFVDAWTKLPAGVDRKAPLSDFYPPEVLDALKTSPSTIDRWAIPQGQGALLGATLGPLPVPKALNGAATGTLSAQQAANQAQSAVLQLKSSLH